MKKQITEVKVKMPKNAKGSQKKGGRTDAPTVIVQSAPPAAQTVAASHAPVQQQPKSKGLLGMAADVVKNVVSTGGLETLLTLGSSLLLADSVVAQRNEVNRLRKLRNPNALLLSDTTIPQGTILGQIPISPQFASDINENGIETTRLAQKANIYLKYKFKDSWVKFQPAAGALNNGQIGFFITSDPRYELTATGVDAVRLVHEFAGVVTNISQPAQLKVPSKNDWLFVSDNHESDTRFTEQGMLWIIAFTDLVLASSADSGVGTTTSLGEFSLAYKIDLKDDSVDGATIAPANQQNRMVFYTESQGTVAFTSSSNTMVFGTPTSTAASNTGIGTDLVLDVNNSKPLTQNPDGTFLVNQAGSYYIEITCSFSYGQIGTPDANLNIRFVNTTSGVTFRHPFVQAQSSGSLALSVSAYMQCDKGDLLVIQILNGSSNVWSSVTPQGAMLSFTQLAAFPVTGSGAVSIYPSMRRGLVKDIRRDDSYKKEEEKPSTPQYWVRGNESKSTQRR